MTAEGVPGGALEISAPEARAHHSLALRDASWASSRTERLHAKHAKIAAAVTSLAAATADTRGLFHRSGWKSVLGAIVYLAFEMLVLWSAFLAIHAHPLPAFPVVAMAYIVGALGGSLPLPASIGTIGGIAGMLIVYGIGHNPAVAAVLLHQAIGLFVPLTGGAIAYTILRRQLGPIGTAQADSGATAVA